MNILEAVLGGRGLPVNYEDNALEEELTPSQTRRSELSKYSRIQHIRLQSTPAVVSTDHKRDKHRLVAHFHTAAGKGGGSVKVDLEKPSLALKRSHVHR